MADQLPDHTIAITVRIGIDRSGNLMQVVSSLGIPDSLKEALTGHFDQLLCPGAYLSHCQRSGGVGMVALIAYAGIQADDIPLP